MPFYYFVLKKVSFKIYSSYVQRREVQAAAPLKLHRPLRPRELEVVVQLLPAVNAPSFSPNQVAVATTAGEILHALVADGFGVLAENKLDYLAALEQ